MATDLVTWCRAERDQLIQQLEHMESGKLKLWQYDESGEESDTTSVAIERARRSLEDVEAILARQKEPD